MKIGIDARLLERRMTGMGRYLTNIVRYISEYDRENQYVLFSYNTLPGFPKNNVINIPTKKGMMSGGLQKIWSALWLHAVLPRFVRKENIDVLFAPNALLPLVDTNTKNVITIPDVFQLINPKFHSPLYRAYISFFLSRGLKKTDLVLTISEASKRDIIRLMHVPENKIKVTYLAAEDRFMPRKLSLKERNYYLEKYKLPERFILYIGVLENRKNIEGIIRIADAMKKKTDAPIVLAGRGGYGGKRFIEEIKRHNNIYYLGFFDDADIPYLYNLAEAFIFPSYYEGFGIPPLEAMQSGTPVVVSNTSSLPEVVGEGGMLLSPTDTKGFSEALLRLLEDKKFHEEMVQKGILQAKKFSYRKLAEETIAALKEVGAKI